MLLLYREGSTSLPELLCSLIPFFNVTRPTRSRVFLHQLNGPMLLDEYSFWMSIVTRSAETMYSIFAMYVEVCKMQNKGTWRWSSLRKGSRSLTRKLQSIQGVDKQQPVDQMMSADGINSTIRAFLSCTLLTIPICCGKLAYKSQRAHMLLKWYAM